MHTFYILVLSPIEKQMRGAYTHELIGKTPEADQPPPGTEAPRIRRRCQNNLHNHPPK